MFNWLKIWMSIKWWLTCTCVLYNSWMSKLSMFKRSFSLQSSHVVMPSRFVPKRRWRKKKTTHDLFEKNVVLVKAEAKEEVYIYLSRFWSEATSWCSPGGRTADCLYSGTAESGGWMQIPPPSGRFCTGRLLPRQNPPAAVWSRTGGSFSSTGDMAQFLHLPFPFCQSGFTWAAFHSSLSLTKSS